MKTMTNIADVHSPRAGFSLRFQNFSLLLSPNAYSWWELWGLCD